MPFIDQKRVVEVLVTGSHKSKFGTGYVLCNGCVLIAKHALTQNIETIKCRLIEHHSLGKDGWAIAKIIWDSAEFDLAVLHVQSEQFQNFRLLTVKKIDLNYRVSCRAYGFPDVTKDEQDGKVMFEPYAVEGWIKPLSSKNLGKLFIEVEGSIPKNEMDGWKGISGSAIFSEDGYLVGVITQGPDNFSGRLLEGISIEHVTSYDKAFCEQITKYSKQELTCLDIDKIEARKYFELELERIATTVKKICTEKKHELEISDIETRLGMQFNSNLPEHELLHLLKQIEGSEQDIFWKVWRQSTASGGVPRLGGLPSKPRARRGAASRPVPENGGFPPMDYRGAR